VQKMLDGLLDFEDFLDFNYRSTSICINALCMHAVALSLTISLHMINSYACKLAS